MKKLWLVSGTNHRKCAFNSKAGACAHAASHIQEHSTGIHQSLTAYAKSGPGDWSDPGTSITIEVVWCFT